MDQYIRYHKQPYAKYLNVKEFNQKFGTDIPEVEHYDDYFHEVLTSARKMQGPSEFLQVKFADHEEFEEMGIFSKIKSGVKAIGKAAKAKAKAGLKAAKAAKDSAKWCAKNPKECKEKAKKALKKKGEAIGDALNDLDKTLKKIPIGEKPEVVNDLDDLLSEEENVVEEEYDEETAAEPVASAPVVTNIVTEKKKIADLVLKASKDSEEYAQDMKHLIQFKSAKLPLEEQLMKGRPKYLKALKAYLKGDINAEVKMSWSNKGKKKGRMVKVSELNPKRDSLKALLRSSAGNIRVVECV